MAGRKENYWAAQKGKTWAATWADWLAKTWADWLGLSAATKAALKVAQRVDSTVDQLSVKWDSTLADQMGDWSAERKGLLLVLPLVVHWAVKWVLRQVVLLAEHSAGSLVCW